MIGATRVFDGPCAIEGRASDIQPYVVFAVGVTYQITDEGPVVFADDGATTHELHLVTEPDIVGPGILIGKAVTGVDLTVRAIEPEDGMIGLGRSCPLPVGAISAAIRGESVPGLQALTDDDGDVVTLMCLTDDGLWTRFSGLWNYVPPGQDPDPLDGLCVFDVDDLALEPFDQADKAGQQISIAALPLGPNESLEGINLPANAVVAAAEVLLDAVVESPLPTIRRVEDLPAAIDAAAFNPELRWYIERRAAALRSDIKLPWRDS